MSAHFCPFIKHTLNTKSSKQSHLSGIFELFPQPYAMASKLQRVGDENFNSAYFIRFHEPNGMGLVRTQTYLILNKIRILHGYINVCIIQQLNKSVY